jgi:cell wall-active antibiotic response 4TMS protein YvqF
MARLRPRGSNVFSGLVLIFIGLLLLLHNYRGFELTGVLLRWWPLILIFWGAIKIYERTAGARASQPGASRITSGEVFLVLGLLALVGIAVAIDEGRKRMPGMDIDLPETFASSIDVAPKPVPANARVTVRGGRGDITVRASDEPEIRVAGKVNVNSWTEEAAKRLGEKVSAEIVQNGDGFEVRPTGVGGGG